MSRGTQEPIHRARFDFVYRTVTFYGSHFPEGSTINLVYHSTALRPDGPYNPREHAPWFGLFRVRSPLLAESLTCFLFLEVLRWFTSLRCLRPPMYSAARYSGMSQSGFPHSEIPGSKPACGSPRLIAACHVLHRLLAPRHSPYALSSLTKCSLHLTALYVVKKTTDCRVFSCQKIRACRDAASNCARDAPRLVVRSWWRIPGSNR